MFLIDDDVEYLKERIEKHSLSEQRERNRQPTIKIFRKEKGIIDEAARGNQVFQVPSDERNTSEREDIGVLVCFREFRDHSACEGERIRVYREVFEEGNQVSPQRTN